MRFLFYRWLFFFGNSVYDRYLRVILQDMGTPFLGWSASVVVSIMKFFTAEK